MAMENQAANRRINLIAGHFAATDEILSTTHLSTLKCSNSLNNVTTRYDNRMHFARQGSGSQACFMRQPSLDKKSSSISYNVIPRCDNRMYFARQGSDFQTSFMRQASVEQDISTPVDNSLRCSGSVERVSFNTEDPLFCNPAKMVPNFANKETKQDCKSSANDPPEYARPNKRIQQIQSKKKHYASQSIGSKWSPRMDIAETGSSYVVTIELPGAGIRDIRVEVNDQNLVIMSKHSTHWWKVASYSNDSISAYNRREISRGPYQVVWPLPADVNKDSIAAELVNGILQVAVPKL